MACSNHPNYGGKRTPRSGCKSCLDFYNENKGIYSTEGNIIGQIQKPTIPVGNIVGSISTDFKHIPSDYPCEDRKEDHEFVTEYCVKCLKKKGSK